MCVFILTSSIYPDDVAKTRRYQEVRGYLSKPLDKPNAARMPAPLHEGRLARWLAPVLLATAAAPISC